MRKPTKLGPKQTLFRGWQGIVIVLLGGLLLAWLFLIPENAGEASTPGPATPGTDPGFDQVENGIHLRTGFAEGEGLMTVVANCTACHSAKLVTQNRMTREGWEQTIRWMQKTQNLWDLGANEAIILDYLAAHYAPEKKGRRQNLTNIEWYELKP